MNLKFLQETEPWDWPEEADGMLLQILGNELADPAQRLIAAELAGNHVVMNDALARVLLKIVGAGHESQELRGAAAIALGPALEYADMMGFEDPDDILISETTFQKIRKKLHKLYMDAGIPRDVRRRILEAAVHAPQPWHQAAVDGAYPSDDPAWRRTAVFCMEFIKGFDRQILESLTSEDPRIHYHAVCAAGAWALDAAWDHVVSLIRSDTTDMPLLLTAIDAVAAIRPHEAAMTLSDLAGSEDEDITAAVFEALAAVGMSDEFDEDDNLMD